MRRLVDEDDDLTTDREQQHDPAARGDSVVQNPGFEVDPWKVIETELKAHDVLALVPIITGAGGVITTWEDAPPHAGGRIVAAGDRRVHAAALALLAS